APVRPRPRRRDGGAAAGGGDQGASPESTAGWRAARSGRSPAGGGGRYCCRRHVSRARRPCGPPNVGMGAVSGTPERVRTERPHDASEREREKDSERASERASARDTQGAAMKRTILAVFVVGLLAIPQYASARSRSSFGFSFGYS